MAHRLHFVEFVVTKSWPGSIDDFSHKAAERVSTKEGAARSHTNH